VRMTVVQPDRVGEVARLSTAIAKEGGYLTVFVTYPSPEPGTWTSVIKVTRISKERLIEVVSSLEDVQIKDVHEV